MRILVAVDLRERAEETVENAARWGERLGGKIDLVYVEDYVPSGAPFLEPTVQNILTTEWERLREVHRDQLQGLMHRVAVQSRGEVQVLTGLPAPEIAAASANYDLVVMTSHQRTGLGQLLIGSVAERVVRTARCATLVVPLSQGT